MPLKQLNHVDRGIQGKKMQETVSALGILSVDTATFKAVFWLSEPGQVTEAC